MKNLNKKSYKTLERELDAAKKLLETFAEREQQKDTTIAKQNRELVKLGNLRILATNQLRIEELQTQLTKGITEKNPNNNTGLRTINDIIIEIIKLQDHSERPLQTLKTDFNMTEEEIKKETQKMIKEASN